MPFDDERALDALPPSGWSQSGGEPGVPGEGGGRPGPDGAGHPPEQRAVRVV